VFVSVHTAKGCSGHRSLTVTVYHYAATTGATTQVFGLVNRRGSAAAQEVLASGHVKQTLLQKLAKSMGRPVRILLFRHKYIYYIYVVFQVCYTSQYAHDMHDMCIMYVTYRDVIY
jgi:hypothetical protein